MTTMFRPDRGSARPAIPAPRAAYDLAWLNCEGHPEWGTRMLPATASVESACAAVARGCLIETATGPVAIEDLTPGDLIRTMRGTVETLRWIGARSYAEHIPPEDRSPLFRIGAGAFGDRAPHTDTVLAGPAAIWVDTPACRKIIGQDTAFAPLPAFEDGINISRITPPGEITVYNLAFDAQEAFIANGLPIESFHPGRNTMQVLNDDVLRDMARLFPHLTAHNGFGPQRAPRLSITEARMLDLV